MICVNTDRAKLIQLYINWGLTMLLGINMSSVFIMMFPTLHSFVVNPKNKTCEEPGLGGSETLFSIAAGIYSGGAVFAGLIALVLFSKPLLPLKFLLIGTPILTATGSLIYALSVEPWMVILGRFFLGTTGSLTLLAFIWYCVASVDEYNLLCERLGRPLKQGLKRQLTVIFGIIVTVGYVVFTGIVTLVANFPSVDQFRFPAWFNFAMSGLVFFLMLLFFKDIGIKKASDTNEKKHFKFEMPNITTIFVVAFLLYSGSVIDGTLTMMEAFNSPVLSRYFGFDISDIAYFTFGVTTIFPLSAFLLLLLERLRVSSRAVLFVALLFNAIGVALLADWQSVGTNTQQCSQFSATDTLGSSAIECISSDLDSKIQSSGGYIDTRIKTFGEEKCLSNEECYWNPDSIITGKYCNTCPAICHSTAGSLHFVQVCIGVFFIGLSVDMTRYTTMPLMSKVVPANLKVPPLFS